MKVLFFLQIPAMTPTRYDKLWWDFSFFSLPTMYVSHVCLDENNGKQQCYAEKTFFIGVLLSILHCTELLLSLSFVG